VALHRALEQARERARAAGIALPPDEPLRDLVVKREGNG
jgi:hypothetical protein